MKLLSINTGWQTQRLIFVDDAKADAAYAALKTAIDAYDRFGNDKEKSVSILDDTGEATFKIDLLVAVYIQDLSEAADEAYVQSGIRNARISARLKEITGSNGVLLPVSLEHGDQDQGAVRVDQ